MSLDTPHFTVRLSKLRVEGQPFRDVYYKTEGRANLSQRQVAQKLWDLYGVDTDDAYTRRLATLEQYLHYINYKQGNPVVVLPTLTIQNGEEKSLF